MPAQASAVGRSAAPLTVLHVTAPGPAGGLETVILSLARLLLAEGHAPHVAALVDRADHPFVRMATTAGVEVTPIVTPPRAYLGMRRRVVELIRASGALVVHTHGYVADLLAGSAARALGVPVVSTAHGFTGGGLKNRLYEFLQRRAFRRAAAVIAVAQPVLEHLVRAGVPRGRLHLVRNAWQPQAGFLDRAAARERLGLSDASPVIGWVGRLSEEKGPAVFLQALLGLGATPAWQAVLVGEGPERDRLGELARGTPSGAVRFAGLVPDAASCFPAFDVFVLSSRTEGTPMVLFEAMAAGVPIVATRVGGVPDVVGPGEAILVPPEDPGALSRAIVAALEDHQATTARVAAARRRLELEFAPRPWCRAHVALYEALAGRPPSP